MPYTNMILRSHCLTDHSYSDAAHNIAKVIYDLRIRMYTAKKLRRHFERLQNKCQQELNSKTV